MSESRYSWVGTGILIWSLFFKQYVAINEIESSGLSMSTNLRAVYNKGNIVLLRYSESEASYNISKSVFLGISG